MMVDTVDTLEQLGMIQNGMNILDVGCFIGNWGRTIHEKGYDVNYIGLDCNKASLAKAKEIIPQYKFIHIDAMNKTYNPFGKVLACDIKLPIDDKWADIVLCHSLFTHLGNFSNAVNYMNEIKRVLKPGGKLWVTFFQDPPNDSNYGTKRTVYTADEIGLLMIDFKYLHAEGGYTADYNDQLMIAASYE